MSTVRTAMLLAGLTALFMAVGYFIGGQGGMLIALAIAIAMNAFSYWNSDKLVLRMYGAQQVDARAAPELVGLVEQLAARAQLPMPKVFVIDQPQPNAFATGRNPENAAVAPAAIPRTPPSRSPPASSASSTTRSSPASSPTSSPTSRIATR